MSFESDEPVYFNQQICSLEIFAPSQIVHADDAFELMASAWFGTTREDIKTASGMQSITIGLHSATLIIDTCNNSRMRNDSRYRSEPLTLTYEHLKDDVSKNAREGSTAGGFAVPLLWVFNLKGEGKVQAAKSSTDSAKRHQDSIFEVYEVDSASPKGWSIGALNPARPQPYLKGAELRDVALCTIDTPNSKASVAARVEVSATDLWLDINSATEASKLEDDANQRAVLSALIGKAVEENGSGEYAEDPEQHRVVVAQSVLHRRAPQEST